MAQNSDKKCYPKKKSRQYFLEGYHAPESFLFGTLPSFFKSAILRDNTVLAQDWFTPAHPEPRTDKLAIYWIGHASFLIQLGGKNILLDPVFGNPSFLFQRQFPPGISRDRLPPLDVVLISHNHPDHLELRSLAYLAKDHAFSLYVPEGDGRLLGGYNYQECTWWQSVVIDESLRLTFLPAAHWSRCGLFDANSSLWGSWMIEYGSHRVYFGGDTAYFSHFSSIAHHFASIEVALLPIAPVEPRAWMRRTHMNGEDAVQAFSDLGATHLIPMHWGTFRFGIDALEYPLEVLKSAWDQAQFASEKKLTILKMGGKFSL